jgi:hypothetical protein
VRIGAWRDHGGHQAAIWLPAHFARAARDLVLVRRPNGAVHEVLAAFADQGCAGTNSVYKLLGPNKTRSHERS